MLPHDSTAEQVVDVFKEKPEQCHNDEDLQKTNRKIVYQLREGVYFCTEVCVKAHRKLFYGFSGFSVSHVFC